MNRRTPGRKAERKRRKNIYHSRRQEKKREEKIRSLKPHAGFKLPVGKRLRCGAEPVLSERSESNGRLLEVSEQPKNCLCARERPTRSDSSGEGMVRICPMPFRVFVSALKSVC